MTTVGRGVKVDFRRCARCGVIPRGKSRIAEAARYAPYCSYQCQEMQKVSPRPDARRSR